MPGAIASVSVYGFGGVKQVFSEWRFTRAGIPPTEPACVLPSFRIVSHGERISYEMPRQSFEPSNFLTVGAVGGLGLTLADFLQLRQAQAEQKHYDFIEAKAESVIHIFLPGGIAHQESFDPKPYSPIEYRGEMGSIKTNTGEVFSETLPQLAKIADKIAVIRSMTHGEAAHERGTHNMFTGYQPSPALQYPQHGQRGQPRVRPAEQPAAVRLHSEPAERLRRHRLPELVVRSVQPRVPIRPPAASRFAT